MRKLGLIGGLGPQATLHYYRELTKTDPGEMLLIHADMQHALDCVRAGEIEALAAYFARLIDRLASGGAEIAAISAVTPHICIRELEKISVLPLVSIIDEVAAEIRSRGYRKIGLFGTRFTVASSMFGLLDEVEVIKPDESDIDAIHDAYMGAVDGSTEGREVLQRIAHELPVDAIVLAGTDLAVLFDESNTDFPHVDAAQVHIDAILRRLDVG